MRPFSLVLLATVVATPALAQDQRDLDAHVHGVSTLQIAVEEGMVEMNLLSPGVDIVGFEYEASSEDDKDAVETAIRQFLRPEELVTLPEGAGCRLTEVVAHLDTGDHEDEMHAEHVDGESMHDEAETAEIADDPVHEDEHVDEAGAEHSAFHVIYGYACENPDALTTVSFPFFERFENAGEIEVQYATEAGAGTAELTGAAPELSLN